MVTAALLKNRYILILVVIAAMLFILFFFKPAPLAAGDCIADCTHTEEFFTEEEFYNINGNPCPGGCGAIFVDHVTEVARYGWSVTCECCNCVGSQTAGLGTCNYPAGWLFNPIGQWLGLCKVR